jgi:hypothetical protein
LGSGIKNLYEKVSRRYLNITRKDIQNFLQNQETYQLAKKPLVMTGKKITYSKSNAVWSADLIDLNPFLSSALRQLCFAVSFSPHILPQHFAVIF